MSQLDLSQLAEYLKSQRWFGGKGWPIREVWAVDHAELPAAARGGRVPVLAVAEVRYDQGARERYQLLLERSPAGGLEPAAWNEAVAQVALALIRRGDFLPSAAGTLRGERIEMADSLLGALSAAPKVRAMSAEQSNSSLVFDDRAIFKVIRKVEPGLNVEYEVGRFLARHGFRAAPPLLGALHLEGPAGCTLAVMHPFLAGSEEGWSYVLRALRGSSSGLLEDVRALGEQIGAMHRALAIDSGDPGFAPEPVQREDLHRWASSLEEEVGATLALAAEKAPQLAQRREKLLEEARAVGRLHPSGKRIRIHGDLHLGQTLRSPRGWLTIDFEGEPGRTLAQRREKQSPLRDVAGMLRSFAYAAATLKAEGREVGPWESRARQSFLEGYGRAVEGAGLLPESPEDRQGALAAFELEKLLYEVRYELHNRPDWAHIPIGALLSPKKERW